MSEAARSAVQRLALAAACATAIAAAGCGQALHATTRTSTAATAVARPTAPAASSTPAATVTPRRPHSAPATFPRPRIVQRRIPFGHTRRAQMVAYVRRHYGSFMRPTYRLIHPRVIVEHWTESATFSSAYNTFASDAPDSELHETPGTCAHFVIDRDGTIYQLVSTSIMCRHTVGLNWTAFGIEQVGFSDHQILGDPRQMHASLALTCWLRSRFHIRLRNVIGHNESLSSPYHREDVARLRHQTHNDMAHRAMQIYRERLRPTCPGV